MQDQEKSWLPEAAVLVRSVAHQKAPTPRASVIQTKLDLVCLVTAPMMALGVCTDSMSIPRHLSQRQWSVNDGRCNRVSEQNGVNQGP
jgi:hypothetical protein